MVVIGNGVMTWGCGAHLIDICQEMRQMVLCIDIIIGGILDNGVMVMAQI